MNRRGFLKIAGGTGLGLVVVETARERFAADTVYGQAALAKEPSAKNLILTNASLIDGVRPEPQLKATVVVKEERIVRVGPVPPTRTESRESQIIDLGGAWLLPGLCDAHSHLISPLQAPPGETVIDRYLRFGKGAIDALQVGVTSARVLGAPDFVDVAWRKAFARGMFLGPRLFVAGHAIICTGGHGSGYNYGQSVVANGPAEIRRAVREQMQADVDLIK